MITTIAAVGIGFACGAIPSLLSYRRLKRAQVPFARHLVNEGYVLGMVHALAITEKLTTEQYIDKVFEKLPVISEAAEEHFLITSEDYK